MAMGSLGSRTEGAGGGGGEEVDTEAVPLQSMHWSQKTRMAQLGVPCFHAHEHLLPGQNAPKRFSPLNPAICLSSTTWAGIFGGVSRPGLSELTCYSLSGGPLRAYFQES